MVSVESSWMRLGFQVDVSGKVPVKVVARTFASGKTEKLIYQAFAELGLPSEKVIRCHTGFAQWNPSFFL